MLWLWLHRLELCRLRLGATVRSGGGRMFGRILETENPKKVEEVSGSSWRIEGMDEMQLPYKIWQCNRWLHAIICNWVRPNSRRSGRDLVEQVRFLAFRNWKPLRKTLLLSHLCQHGRQRQFTAWEWATLLKCCSVFQQELSQSCLVDVLEMISSESSGSRIQVIDSNCPTTFQTPLT